jgi:signal transduction histidine kinase
LEFRNLDTLFGAVMKTGEPVISNNPSTDPRRGGLPPGHPPLHAFLGLPVHHRGQLLAMVGIANRPGGYDESVVEYLRPLLATCGSIIQADRSDQRRRSAEQDLRLANAQLEQALYDLSQTQQQLVQQERLRALGTMASGIAHNFNNALMAITGFSELLRRHLEAAGDLQKSRHYLQMIQIAAEDAAAEVRRLREFYRPRSNADSHGPVDLNRLVAEAILLTQPRWKDQESASGSFIRIETDLQPVPPLEGDEGGLREVLANLILNAVDAMPDGGTIILRSRTEDPGMEPRTETAASRAGGPVALIEISDTGQGMDEETRRCCFEPFFSTKGVRGTGLGLAVVYGIVQRHRGTIELESALGGGRPSAFACPLLLFRRRRRPRLSAERRVPSVSSSSTTSRWLRK